MSLLSKSATFLCITAFSGSMVILGARDLRNALSSPSSQDLDRAKKLIQQLRGDELFRIEAKYSEVHEKPQRKPGSVLPDYDLAKIKRFVAKLIMGDSSKEPDEVVDEPAK